MANDCGTKRTLLAGIVLAGLLFDLPLAYALNGQYLLDPSIGAGTRSLGALPPGSGKLLHRILQIIGILAVFRSVIGIWENANDGGGPHRVSYWKINFYFIGGILTFWIEQVLIVVHNTIPALIPDLSRYLYY